MVVIIVYGSLFPFDFLATPLPVSSLFAEWHIFQSRSDAVDNFLLFLPLGIALHACFTRTLTRIVASLLALVVLGLGIQFVQLYLPARTAALSDAWWNMVGLAAGFLIAGRFRAVAQRYLPAVAAGHDLFAAMLVVLWFFYESFPFVPTLDVGLLRDHIKTVVRAPPFEGMRVAQHALAATLGGIAMLRTGWLRPRLLNLALPGAAALALEVVVAYGSLRRETLLGIVLGLCAAVVLDTFFARRTESTVLLLALATYTLTVFTPFRAPGGSGFTFTPFSHLLWQGITRDVPPIAFEALTIGALLWAGLTARRGFRRHPYFWLACVLLLLCVMEAMRVYAGFQADTTSLVVALVLGPFAISLGARSTMAPALSERPPNAHADGAPPVQASRSRSRDHSPVPVAPISRKAAVLWLGAAFLVLTGALALFVRLPGVPYNFLKLFGDRAWGPAFLALALLWLGGGPWLLAQWLQRWPRRPHLWLALAPLLLIPLALVSFWLLNLAAPDYMVDKLIGTPDSYRRAVVEKLWGEDWAQSFAAWPPGLVMALERASRYCALHSLLAIPLLLCALAVPRRQRARRVLSGFLVLLPVWWLAKYIVIDWAVTDNVIELVSKGGGPFLALLLVLAASHATALACLRRRGRMGPAVLLPLSLALLVLTWWLFNQGMEPVVINHGRVFAARQFLLGQNRTELLSESALFARWGVLYLGGVVTIAVGLRLAMALVPMAVSERTPLRR